MSVINVSLEHGQTFEQARSRMRTAVGDAQKLFGALVRTVSWNANGDQARIDGTGFWIEMKVDAKHLHATGDIPVLAGLLGGPMAKRLEQVVERSFQKKLT
jgi:hypothetical protein